MTILSRITRLVKADVHGILDGLEDPLVILKQAVREMEEAIASDKEYSKEFADRRELAIKQRGLLAKAFAEIEHQLDLCFSNGQDNLAKSFVRRKLETRRRLDDLDQRIEAIDSDRKVIEARIVEREEKLTRVAEQVSTLEQEEALARKSFSTTPERPFGSISQEDVEIAYIAELQKRSPAAGQSGRTYEQP